MKKIISIFVSFIILVLLYNFLDFNILLQTLTQADISILLISSSWLTVLVVMSGLRLAMLGAIAGHPIATLKAVKATFAASTLNIFLPGKLGDLLKASLLVNDDPDSVSVTVGLVVWEKLADLTTLFLLGSISLVFAATNFGAAVVMGLLTIAGIGVLVSKQLAAAVHGIGNRFFGHQSSVINRMFYTWGALLTKLGAGRTNFILLLGVSFVIWAGHIIQICLFAYALGVTGDFSFWLNFAGLVPIVIVTGLIPLTFAGVGTRDAALVVIFGNMIGVETAAALGILFWLRYLIPGILGTPLLPNFLRVVLKQSKIV